MQHIWHHRLSRIALINLGCLGFLAGLGIAAIGWQVNWLTAMAAAACLACTFRRRTAVALPVILAAMLIIGLWRGGEVLTGLAVYKGFIGQKVELQGQVSEDPTFDDKQQLDIRITGVSIESREVVGVVRIKTLAPISPKRGDLITAKGKLYDGFGNYQASMYYADVHIMSHNINIVNNVRDTFASAVRNTLPEPQASLGLEFLIGLSSQLPDSLSDKLKILGLTHIVVASGYNLTILVRVALQKYSSYQTVVTAGLLVAGFLAITGFSPSMTRAALVTGLALIAWYYGRRIHPLTLLLFVAAVTAGVNPLFLWHDIGWWLSFLAFGGVMLLSPLLQYAIFGRSPPKLIGQLVLETLSAEIMALPLVIWLFGDVPVLSLLANVIIGPLVPVAMLCTAIAGVAGLLAAVPYLAYAALPGIWVLTYITDVVGIMAAVPWAQISFTIGWQVMLAWYMLVICAALLLWRRTRYDYLSGSIVD